MPHHGVAVETHVVVEILLGIEKLECAVFAPLEAVEGRVAHLPRSRQDLFPELNDDRQQLPARAPGPRSARR